MFNNPVKVSQIFADMFEEPTPWHNSLSDAVIRKEQTNNRKRSAGGNEKIE